MTPRWTFVATVVLATLLLACRGNRGSMDDAQDALRPPQAPAQKPAQPIITPVTNFFGRVASVNQSLRYAVVEFPPGAPLPKPNERLGVYRGAMKVGELKISPQSRGSIVAADITAGEAAEDDLVKSE